LVNAVREPHPHLIEVKKEYQYIKSALTDPKKLTVEVKNWYDFTNLNAYTLHWQVMGDDGKVIAEGTRKADCAPHEVVTFSLGAVKLPSTIREAYLNLSWTPDKELPLLELMTKWPMTSLYCLPTKGIVRRKSNWLIR
jgi:hypothetical protein